ncbi:hypothetical protein D1007_07150 [Hordeum vulgare]|nr:hypothetical protein D1007_07150 [Hordeum vulgare]
MELEAPFFPEDAGYAEFSSELVKELKSTSKKVDNIVEEECRDHFAVAATRVFSHLLLREHHVEFTQLMTPLPKESRGALATTMEGHVRMLLEKFSYDDNEKPDEELSFLS